MMQNVNIVIEESDNSATKKIDTRTHHVRRLGEVKDAIEETVAECIFAWPHMEFATVRKINKGIEVDNPITWLDSYEVQVLGVTFKIYADTDTLEGLKW